VELSASHAGSRKQSTSARVHVFCWRSGKVAHHISSSVHSEFMASQTVYDTALLRKMGDCASLIAVMMVSKTSNASP
jgi:hypothetical protein